MQQSAACQIIAVNDGSVDGSLELLRPFLPAITVLSGPNQGPAAARNRGLAEATGDWTIFLDADDELLPGTIEKRLETAARTGADVVIADWEEEREEADGKIVTTIGHFDWAAFEADPELATGIIAWAQIGSNSVQDQLDPGDWRVPHQYSCRRRCPAQLGLCESRRHLCPFRPLGRPL